MSVEVRKVGKIAIFDFDGTLTLGKGCEELRAKFKAALEGGDQRFVFNMLKVPFLDSSGVGEVIACHKRARDKDGLIKLALKGKSHELFVFWELHKLFTIYDDVESALAGFAE